MGRTMAQALIEEGKQLGRTEGELKGKAEGKAEALIRLLEVRFGSVPEALEKKVMSIRQIEILDAIFEYAITAKTIDEVEKAMEEF